MKKEEIIIIGGYYTGVISGILLDRINRQLRHRKFSITLIVPEGCILANSCRLVDRLSVGMQYVHNCDLAHLCLRGALLLKQFIPNIDFGENTSSYFIKKPPVQNNKKNRKYYVDHDDHFNSIECVFEKCTALQKQYALYHAHIINQRDQHIHAPSYHRPSADSGLFGKPDNFFNLTEAPSYANGYAFGVTTKEPIVNSAMLGAYFEQCLKEADITIMTGTVVSSACKTKHGYELTCQNRDRTFTLTADQVINANAHNSFVLDQEMDADNNYDKITWVLRHYLELDVSNCLNKYQSMLSLYSPQDNDFSYTAINSRVGLLTCKTTQQPHVEHMIQSKFMPTLAHNWKERLLSTENSKDEKYGYLNAAKDYFPFLEDAIAMRLHTVMELSVDQPCFNVCKLKLKSMTHQRTWINAHSFNLSSAMLIALQISNAVQLNSLNKDKIPIKDCRLFDVEKGVVLPDELCLSCFYMSDSVLTAAAKSFAKTRGLSDMYVS